MKAKFDSNSSHTVVLSADTKRGRAGFNQGLTCTSLPVKGGCIVEFADDGVVCALQLVEALVLAAQLEFKSKTKQQLIVC
jgi:hypothetical protein